MANFIKDLDSIEGPIRVVYLTNPDRNPRYVCLFGDIHNNSMMCNRQCRDSCKSTYDQTLFKYIDKWARDQDLKTDLYLETWIDGVKPGIYHSGLVQTMWDLSPCLPVIRPKGRGQCPLTWIRVHGSDFRQSYLPPYKSSPVGELALFNYLLYKNNYASVYLQVETILGIPDLDSVMKGLCVDFYHSGFEVYLKHPFFIKYGKIYKQYLNMSPADKEIAVSAVGSMKTELPEEFLTNPNYNRGFKFMSKSIDIYAIFRMLKVHSDPIDQGELAIIYHGDNHTQNVRDLLIKYWNYRLDGTTYSYEGCLALKSNTDVMPSSKDYSPYSLIVLRGGQVPTQPGLYVRDVGGYHEFEVLIAESPKGHIIMKFKNRTPRISNHTDMIDYSTYGRVRATCTKYKYNECIRILTRLAIHINNWEFTPIIRSVENSEDIRGRPDYQRMVDHLKSDEHNFVVVAPSSIGYFHRYSMDTYIGDKVNWYYNGWSDGFNEILDPLIMVNLGGLGSIGGLDVNLPLGFAMSMIDGDHRCLIAKTVDVRPSYWTPCNSGEIHHEARIPCELYAVNLI